MAESESKKGKDKSKKISSSDMRIRLLVGMSLVVFSVVLFLSFLSFLIYWKYDYAIFDMPLAEMFSSTEPMPSNWIGRVGVIFSVILMLRWVGVSAFAIIPLIFLTGLRVLGKKIHLNRISLRFIIPMLFMSVFLGYLFEDKFLLLSGAHGHFVSQWLMAIFGTFGAGIILLFIAAIILAYLFEPIFYRLISHLKELWRKTEELYHKFKQAQKKSELTSEPAEVNQEEEEPENNSPVNEISEPIENEVVVDSPNYEFIVENPVQEEEFIATQIEEESNEQFMAIQPGEAENNLIVVNIFHEEQDSGNANLMDDLSSSEVPDKDVIFEINKTEDDPAEENSIIAPVGKYDPKLDLNNYQYPSLSLLPKVETSSSSVTNQELQANKEKIVETLANYGIKIDTIKATIGPTVTLYEIVPAPGIRISKIKNLENDIALSLAALGIRIIAPMPGKGTIGIEVPNQNPEIVHMRSVLASKKFQESNYQLPLALGKTITNETYVIDLAKAPHLLIAGATGQGKSVGLNAILVSLLFKKHPAELKLVLVDPKKVELALYNKIERHFLAALPASTEPIITDTTKVINTLNSLCIEMENRYELLKLAQVRHLLEYNEKFINRQLNPIKGHRYLPYIVVVIDEFADLIMTAGKEIETPIARIAQMARAVGIHMIIATQRPTTNIITGTIKANFPARIAFRVTSGIDSKTILDGPGANQLIGRGDMLVAIGSEPVRVQCAFLDTPEVESIVEFIAGQPSYPSYFELPEYVGEETQLDIASVDLSQRDPLFDEAARLIVIHQQGSTSLIQRKFSIGYARAGRIIDQLEAAGVVGPFEGSKARQVLIPDEISLEQLLKNIR